MNIHLTPELEKLVQEKVDSRQYDSVGEVVVHALRLLEEHGHIQERRRQEIRRKIAEGLESLDRGEGVAGQEVFARLEAELDDLERGRRAG